MVGNVNVIEPVVLTNWPKVGAVFVPPNRMASVSRQG
jgi:hypothetical protein